MGKYFGTDGFRGEANVDLTVEHAYQVGRFLRLVLWQKDKKEDDNGKGCYWKGHTPFKLYV